MELKVACYCGQKYKFDVEPVDGRMPFTVNCPVCGADGTPLANDLLIQQPAAPVPAPAPIVVAPIAAPIAAPPPVVESPANPPAIGSKLRITLSSPSPAAAGGTPAAIAPLPISPPRPIGVPMGAGRMQAAGVDPGQPTPKPNFWMGLVGASAGALLGAAVCFLICFLIVQYAGLRWRFLGLLGGSLVTGYLTGAGAQLLGKGEGSKELGAIAAIFAIAGIVAAQYFTTMVWWHNTVIATIDSAYGQSVKDAREAMAMMPNGSDDEIRKYLVKQGTDEGDDVTTNSITSDQIKDFRENQLPGLQELASGQMTKAQFDARNDINADQEKKDLDAESGTFNGLFLLLFLRKTTILSLCAGAGLAYRISANA